MADTLMDLQTTPTVVKAQPNKSSSTVLGKKPKGPVQTAIQAKYKALGGPAGLLGAPLGVESKTADGKGRFCHFQGGSIYWSEATGAHEIHGAIRDLWASMGWENSYLKYPVTDELTTPNGVGRFSNFEAGQIAWSTQMGAAVSALFVAGPSNPNGFPGPRSQSTEGGSGSSPQIRRRLSCSASIHVVDDEDFGDNESGSDDATEEVVLTNAVPQAILEGMEAKAGGEVRVELELTAQAIDNGDVKVKGKATLFEGTSEETTEVNGTKTFVVLVPRDSFMSKTAVVYNTDEGGDKGTIEMTFNNSAV